MSSIARVYTFFFFLMIRRPPRSTLSSSSAASDVYKRQVQNVYDGYGSSEVGGIAVNGRLLPGVEVRLRPVGGLGLGGNEGELLVRAGALTPEWDGAGSRDWVPTGDIVRLDGGKLTFLDRVMNVRKLANGKFLAATTLSLIHISEPTRLLSISYAVFCLKKKTNNRLTHS
eukprot:TRINITY_DN21194_c0_g1_i1.p1 TRINITY_DN21194_c0_g1~~TRINITY_DN21194_c0_g1_i1.p1  ORF type:complete len:171 (-),score=45.77 TRINITY_DN21194_c0_g1_i1:41-553(-)